MKAKIGLEIHTTLRTASKLFCGCPNGDAEDPNTNVCETCMGHPGARIAVNEQAVKQALAICSALKCKIDMSLIFSRKIYFYPDSTKNYQITQFEEPLGTKGELALDSGKTIKITRVHMEEDPGALSYPGTIEDSEYSLIDYNRAGSPLVEIVTEPDFEKPSEAREFLNILSTILSYLGIPKQEQTVKVDANVSIEESGYVRAEIKNISGFKSVEDALKHEIARQRILVKHDKELKQQTRGWNGTSTYLLRTKEVEADYGYITEPNIPRLPISNSMQKEGQDAVPELQQQKVKRYIDELNLELDTAKVIASDPDLAAFFETVSEHVDATAAANWLRRELLKVLNYKEIAVRDTNITPQHVVDVLELLLKGSITEHTAQKIMEQLSDEVFDVSEYVQKNNLAVLSGDGLPAICKQVIADNAQAVADYNAGEEKSLHFLVGKVMQATKGRADPGTIRKELLKLL